MKQDQVQKDRTTDLGVVRINNDVIAAIASIAATEVRGVRGMGGTNFFRIALCDLFARKLGSRGVRIQSADGEVRLSVSILVDYGVDIPRIADEVQENVKRAVEKMTGLILGEVNVIVEGVAAKPAGAERKI